MPMEQQQAIIQLWARHLWWSVEEVTAHLGDLGLDICPSRVEQVGRESGLLLVRRVLRERFQLGPALLRPKDDWLVQRLFARKSRQARPKHYYDPPGQVQTVDVYRYYCLNPVCPYQTFTNLPADLLPYSAWRVDLHMLALQAYEHGRGSYRRVASSVGLSVATSYRWVCQFGGQLLPIAALFGVVRGSGVVGVDEKSV